MPIQSKNPATEQVEQTFDPLSDAELEVKLGTAHDAFFAWKKTTIEQRAALMQKAATEMRTHARDYGMLMTKEMGKPISQAVAEVEKCAWNCEHYAEHAAGYLAPEHIETTAGESYVQFDPMGVVLLVMPWNYPFWQVMRMAVPVLMAGNTIVLKHASNVPQCALACEEIFKKAGFPEGVFQTLLVGSSSVEGILRDKRVVGVSLTGSEKAGAIVSSIAGSEIKPVVMELGGSDPFIVLEDANVEFACEIARTARLSNGGQVCISAKRFIVHESKTEEFCERLTTIFENYTVGDPTQDETEMGPMSSEQGLLDIERQVNESVEMGAKILTGGKRVGEIGYFYAPTILTNVEEQMPVWAEETFGPVASIIPFKTVDEAIELANNTDYGLGASLHTQNMALAKELIPRIEAGMVFVNGFVRTDPRIPTGGVKRSGVGRELGEWGIRAFTNVKTVWIKQY